MQSLAGNRAVARLLIQRRKGWSQAITPGANVDESSLGAVRRIPLQDAGLSAAGGNTDKALGPLPGEATRRTSEPADDRAIVLVPSSFDATRDAHVLLHFHGTNNVGWRQEDGRRPTQDVDASRHRMEEQLAAAVTGGDTQIVGVLPQGNNSAGFGTISSDIDKYVRTCLDLLATDAGVRVKVPPVGQSKVPIVGSGHSAGGNTLSKVAAAESSKQPSAMKALFLFEGINNFRKTHQEPHPTKPGETVKVTDPQMAGRDKLDIFIKLAARRLAFDVEQIRANPAAAAAYLASSFQFRAYFGSSGLYASVHRLLDQAIRTLFSEPVSREELAEQKQRLGSSGLNLTDIPEVKALIPALAGHPNKAELRQHYQVIPVAESSDPKAHKAGLDDATGRMHSLGHNNIVGSGALLNALKATKGMRPAAPVPKPSPHSVLEQLLNGLPPDLLSDDLRRQLLAAADALGDFAPAQPAGPAGNLLGLVEPRPGPSPASGETSAVRRARANAALMVSADPKPRPTLRRGDKGDAVVELQHLLNTAVGPSPPLAADGKFGGLTEAAARSFQKQAGLSVDGIVGPMTWGSLDAGAEAEESTEQPGRRLETLDRGGVAEGAGPVSAAPALLGFAPSTPAGSGGQVGTKGTPTDLTIAAAIGLGREDNKPPAPHTSRLRREDIKTAIANRSSNPKLAAIFSGLDRIVLSLPDEPSQLVACSLMGRAVVRNLEIQFILDPSKSALDLLPPSRASHYRNLAWGTEDFPGGKAGAHEAEANAMAGELGVVRSERRANTGPDALLTKDEATAPKLALVKKQLAAVPGEKGALLHREAAASFVDMQTQAGFDGVTLRILSSFRDVETARANAAKSGNAAAVASFSAHTLGVAVDLQMSAGGQAFAEMTTRPMKNVVDMRSAPAHKWMLLRGEEFGWFPYTNEPWHWEYNPVGFKDRFLPQP